MRRHKGRAGPGTTGPRETGTPLPDAHRDPIPRRRSGRCIQIHTYDLNIGPLGKEFMVLEFRAKPGQVNVIQAFADEHDMGIPDIDGGAAPERPHREAEVERLSRGRQRNTVPVKDRATQLRRDESVVPDICGDQSGGSPDSDGPTRRVFTGKQASHATGGVAAGPRRRSRPG